MAARSYGDACGIARSLDLLGDRWALLVVRELVLGPKRYSDLAKGLRKIAPDVLAQRLRDLEGGGIVERAVAPGPGRAQVYALTSTGQRLEPVLRELGRFGSTLPMPEGSLDFSPDAAAIALRTTFDPGRASDLAVRCRLELSGERYAVAVAEGTLDLHRDDDPGEVDVSLTTSPAVLAELMWHGRSLADATAAGAASYTGPADRLESLFDCFRR